MSGAIGAIERNDGSLLACGAGNIRVGVDGPHDVVVQAVDALGNVGAAAATSR